MTDAQYHLYQVGALYHPQRTSFPERGVYLYRKNSHELVLFFDRPSPAEVAAAREGESEFALVVSGPLIVFCYRFGDPARLDWRIPWSDAPFSVHLVPPAERTPPFDLPTPESRALLHVLLVGAEDGVIRALRATTLSPAFSRALHAAIAAQQDQAWDEAAFKDALAALYRRYPTAAALAAAGERCSGGEE